MKKTNNKKGISLIVLVITIIVMIVLASAIILSLQSSDIIGRANEAKSKNDIASAKELVAVANGEWLLMTEKEQEKNGGDFVTYAEKKLTEAGQNTDELIIDNDGTVEGCIIVYDGVKCGSMDDVTIVLNDIVNDTKNVKIVLMQDITVDNSLLILPNHTATLDLNGKKITSISGTVYNLGDLTIIDSSKGKTGAIIATGNPSNYNKDFDYNGNGIVDFEDYQELYDFITNSNLTVTDETRKYDVNNDGNITVSDLGRFVSNSNYGFAVLNGASSVTNAKLTISGISEENIKGYPTAVQNYGNVEGTTDYLDCN